MSPAKQKGWEMLDVYRAAVERMLKDGLSFGQIEDRINDMPLSAEERAALWLFAAARCDGMLFFTTLGVGEGSLAMG